MTLFQLFLKKLGLWSEAPPEVQEKKVYNPIERAKVGNSFTINSLDFRGLNFFVKEMKEYNVSLGGKKFTDYILVARPVGKPDVMVRLRVVPEDNAHRVFILNLFDDLPFNQGLLDAVKDVSKKFVVDDDKNDTDETNDTHEEYWRVNDVGTSYVATVKTLKDENNDGRVDANEVKTNSVEFWDYSRMTTIDGVEEEQFLFVEMDKDSGWFQLWQGAEIDSSRVDAI